MNISKKPTIVFIFLTVSTLLLANLEEFDEAEIIDLEQFSITGSPFTLKQEDVVISTNSVAKSELRRMGQASLGSTLDGLPGIHSTSYATGAGRPVIRGFDGDRVSILQNGTDTFDASASSPDHAVTVEPLLIDRIDIVRGPSSLLYGNAAIGGVVNVMEKSMHMAPPDGFQGEAEFKSGSVSDETAGGLSVQAGRNEIAWSLGYYNRKAGNYSIPGFAESKYLRELEAHEDEHGDEDENEHEGESEGEHEDEHEEEEHEESFGILGDSFVETESLALGVTWFGESATYNLAFNLFETLYGVPGHSHAHHHHEDEGEHDEEEHGEGEEHEDHDEEEGHDEDEEGSVFVDLENRRTAFRAEWTNLDGFFKSVELDATYGDYRHIEVEGEAGHQGVGTTYERAGYDLRLSSIHRNLGDWSGALGLDLSDETFEAIGLEAFIPPNKKQNLALFAVDRMDAGWGTVEIGARLESQSITPETTILDEKNEMTANLATGLILQLDNSETVAINISFNQRAPNASELYAFGPHVGTGTFEVGDASLGIEKSNNLNASWRKSVGFISGEFTLFFSDFADYIYLEHLDHEAFETLFPDEDDGGLDIVKAEAVEAEFYGFELDIRFNLLELTDRRFHCDLTIDQTRGTNQTDGASLPRIPTRRIGGRLGYQHGPWHLGLGARYHTQAHHLAPEETPTDSYTLAHADIAYHLEVGDNVVEIFAMGRNLADEEARPHTSFVKDRAPLPGRSVELGARVLF